MSPSGGYDFWGRSKFPTGISNMSANQRRVRSITMVGLHTIYSTEDKFVMYDPYSSSDELSDEGKVFMRTHDL